MHLCFLVPPVPIQLLDLPTQKKNETSKTCNNYIQKSTFCRKTIFLSKTCLDSPCIYFRYIRIKIDKKMLLSFMTLLQLMNA